MAINKLINSFNRSLILLCILSNLQVYADGAQNNTQEHTIEIKLLGINDFHGQISEGRREHDKPVGGAAVLASYLKLAQKGMEDRTIITIMGDQVGASTPASSLLHDEPTILFTNSLGNHYCTTSDRMNPLCNIVATIGNHEFDKGQQAMFDLIYGIQAPPTNHWYPLPYYPGANYPYISANIINAATEKPIVPPYIIKTVGGIRIAFIGAILKNAPELMFPAHAEGLKFLDEAETINHFIPEVRAKGAEIIVVLIHEGGNQVPYEGSTQLNTTVDGAIKQIVAQLDDAVDVVMSGHTHQFLNTYISNSRGHSILVTQANSYSTSFAEVTLSIDAIHHNIEKKSAKIITTDATHWPGTEPDEPTKSLVQQAEDSVAPIINSYIGTSNSPISRAQNDDGESTLGNLVADSYRVIMHTDFGITNPHGMRNDLKAGDLTWGELYSVLPFANKIVSLSLSGQDVYELFEQQWLGAYANMLQISGLTYTYDPNKPLGQRVLSVRHQGRPILKEKIYTIATTDFLASGGGKFSVMKKGRVTNIGETDHEVLAQYIKMLQQPFTSSIEGRIVKS